MRQSARIDSRPANRVGNRRIRTWPLRTKAPLQVSEERVVFTINGAESARYLNFKK